MLGGRDTESIHGLYKFTIRWKWYKCKLMTGMPPNGREMLHISVGELRTQFTHTIHTHAACTVQTKHWPRMGAPLQEPVLLLTRWVIPGSILVSQCLNSPSIKGKVMAPTFWGHIKRIKYAEHLTLCLACQIIFTSIA